MARQRKPLSPEARVASRQRPKASGAAELDLTDEELRALTDEGVDPEDVQRLERESRREQEASDHDRDTARDDLEGLASEAEDRR